MIALFLGWIGIVCWIVCFWWMHRISVRQDSLLKELHGMTRRIEGFSRAEHEIIKEVHPAVADIKERMEDVHGAMMAEEKSER